MISNIRLGDIAKIIDCEHKTAPLAEEGYPSIRTPNVGKGRLLLNNVNLVSKKTYQLWTKRSVPQSGDIILAREAPVGNAAIIPKNLKVCLGQRTVLIKSDRNRIIPEYLNYLINSNSINSFLINISNGATVGHLNVTDIRKLKLPTLPPLPIQKKIAAILSSYDELVENNNRRIAILEKMAEEIYREWFVRMRFPGHEKVKVVKGVPEGWEVVKVKNIVDRNRFGKIYREDELFESGKVVVIDQSIKNYLGYYDGEPEHVASIDDPIILFGDHSCKMLLMIEHFSLAENVIPYRSKGNIPIVFLFYLIHNLIETTEYKRHWTELINKSVFLPDPKLQEMYSDKTKNLLLEKDKLIKANHALKQSRDLLLPRLISGKLDVEKLNIAFPPGMSNTGSAEGKEAEAA